MKKKICPNCAEAIQASDTICTHCGHELEIKEDIKVYQEDNESNRYEQEQDASNPFSAFLRKRGPYNKWIALILCFFLGVFGAHKLYEGKIGMAILYLVTGGLCGIGWVLDLIALILKPNQYYIYY